MAGQHPQCLHPARVERSNYHYHGKGADQADLKQRIKEIVDTRIRNSYRRIQISKTTFYKPWALTCLYIRISLAMALSEQLHLIEFP